jgi:DNA (cytosine-5)-methyltransferase 1
MTINNALGRTIYALSDSSPEARSQHNIVKKPRLLDLFCGAGGAAVGYSRAGFEVVGVDIKPQPHYPFEFHQADALTYPLEGFDAYHASPPCQFGTIETSKKYRGNHQNLIPQTQILLKTTHKPYVIENVPNNKKWLNNPFMLCGTMFGLNIYRHRYFEVNFEIPLLQTSCCHFKSPVLITGTHRRSYEPRYEYSVADCREASGINWMIRTELDQAIPPAYTEYIGKYLMEAIGAYWGEK